MNDSMNVAGEAINKPSSKEVRTRSRFPSLSYHFYNTERFGEYNVPFVMECVEGDKVPIRSGGRVQSYTLKAPLMQTISKKKDFYLVPMEAILPKNWDKFYTNPVIGDDVPDDCGTGVANFWTIVPNFAKRLLARAYAKLIDTTATVGDILTALVRTMVTLEYFYSNGSLMHTLGCNGSRYFHYQYSVSGTNDARSFDRWFDEVMGIIQNIVPFVAFTDGDGFTKVAVLNPATHSGYRLSFSTVNVHDLLQYFRDDLNCKIGSTSATVTQSTLATVLADHFNPASTKIVKTLDVREVNYNLARLWAYQLVCAHFYSNDHVDFIYSAELYRQLIRYCNLGTSNSPQLFTCNGLTYEYDHLSAKYFDYLITTLDDDNECDYFLNSDLQVNKCRRGYLSNLLSYRRSLRFVDYFVGARTRPLAVGDVNVDVNSGTPNYVNVVDVSRNIQRQRFFNAVNRFGRKFEEYIKGLSGITPRQDYHNPLYIAHTSDVVYGTEVENTGADQLTQKQTVTARLQSNGNRYQFEVDVDRPSILIGISYYDIARAYLWNCERQLMHMNRFDMFNPFMQFIGDQEVYYSELGSYRGINYTGAFGYQLRHMEYKQRVPMAAGGFVENLPGYIFTDDSDAARVNGGVQSSDFIHSLNGELDDFYVKLTGYSLGSYFHFIVDNDNFCDASRPMAFAPSIL